jgi:hypothetical protein
VVIINLYNCFMHKVYLLSLLIFAIAMLSYNTIDNNRLSKTSGQISLSKNSIADSIPKKKKKDPIAEDIKRLMPPVPPSFSSADSARLIVNWTIGIKFYKAGCAKCHGIFGKGKDSIPNFSKEQIDDYKTAFLAGDKLNHAVMSKMTETELNAVFLFITNVKK